MVSALVMGTYKEDVRDVNVPPDPSHPGCGKFIILRGPHFYGEHCGYLEIAYRQFWRYGCSVFASTQSFS